MRTRPPEPTQQGSQLLGWVLHPEREPSAALGRWSLSSDAPAALELAKRAGLGPLLQWKLGLEPRPGPASLAWRVVLDNLLDTFHQHAVPVILLKGADLAVRAWPRADLRTMGDVDLLIRKADRAEAEQVLRESLFEPARGQACHHTRWQNGILTLELHTDLFDHPHGLRIDHGDLWDRAESAHRNGALRLHPADAFLHVAGHAVYSDALRTPASVLRSSLDLVFLERALLTSPAPVWQQARTWGLEAALSVALRIAESHFPGTLTPWLAAYRAPGLNPRISLGEQLARRNARLALVPGRRTPPATWIRALLAPCASTGLRMRLTAARRRHRPFRKAGLEARERIQTSTGIE